ncbi:MAG: hypothetical protein HON04_02335 [Planctomicrobium sp.]|jgi:hypothetical protein|nr:hypothetical protein [Planctomicrobium sp.]
MVLRKLTCCLLLTFLHPAFLLADETEDLLRDRGVRISSNGAMLVEELQLTRDMREVTQLQRNIVSADKRFEEYKRAVAILDGQIATLNRRSTLLNSQLANVTNVASNNRLVGAINANDGLIRLAYQKKEQLAKI